MSDPLNFPVIRRDMAEAMRVNRRPRDLLMPATDWKPDRMPERAVVELKYDGFRMGYSHPWNAFTREGVSIGCASHLLPALNALDDMMLQLFGQRHIIDAEYCHDDGFEGAIGDLQRGQGTGIAVIFDAVPLDAYEGRAPSPPLLMRKVRAQRAFDSMPRILNGGIMVSAHQVFEGERRDNIELCAGVAWEGGHEGIMVKDADSPYVRGASAHWQRIKRKKTADLRILLVEVIAGRLKALVLDNDGVEVRVGVGFSAADRENPARFAAGMIVEVSHLGETPRGSLRSPSFLRIRTDKKG